MKQRLLIAKVAFVAWTRRHAEVIAFFAVVLCIVVVEAALIFWYLRPHGYEQRKEFAQIVAAAAAGTVVIGQIYYTRRNLAATEKNIEQTRATAQESIAQTREAALKKEEIDREGQITERFTRAVEQLGNESVVVRAGGIYALERIMKDSPRDQPTIVEILSAYVREHSLQMLRNDEAMKDDASMRDASPSGSNEARRWGEDYAQLRGKMIRTQTDAQAALYVLGRRTLEETQMGIPALDFSHLSLSDLRLFRHFQGAGFFRSNLLRVVFYEALLADAQFQNAVLTNVQFVDSEMDGVNFTNATFAEVRFHRTDLANTIGLSQAQLDKCMTGSNGSLPPGLHWPGEPSPASPDSTP